MGEGFSSAAQFLRPRHGRRQGLGQQVAEAALARGMRVQLLLPLPEPEFIAQSILPASDGDSWRKRYYQLRGNPLCLPPRVMPDCLGPLPKDGHGKETSPFERCNQWLLNSALALGIKAVFLVLTFTGDATMWMAVFADMGASLLVVGNGLRLLKK